MTHTHTSWNWRHIHIPLPADWEMLRFSRRLQQGDCLFADRHTYRLELNWKQVDGKPDFDRMLTDYQHKLKAEFDITNDRRIQFQDWQGIYGLIDTTHTSRYGKYFDEQNLLVELVFTDIERPQTQAHQAILSQVHLVPPAHGRQHWTAFGIDCLPADDLSLTSCQVQPANIAMSFTTGEPKSLRLERYERIGMVDFWLKGSVHEWLSQKLPRDARDTRQTSITRHGHHLELITAQVSAGFPRLTAKPYDYAAAAWICPADGRLYTAAILQRQAPDPADLLGARLACCTQLDQAQRAIA